MDKVEILVLRNLLYNEEYLRKVVPFINADYFEDSQQKIVFEEILNFVNEYNDLFHETEIPHSKLCFEYMKFDIVGNELDQSLLRAHLGIVRYCEKL